MSRVTLLTVGCLAVVLSAGPARADNASALPTDPDFERFVSAAAVRSAIVRFTPDGLAELAEKLAAGERALGRPRKGLPADAVIKIAVRLAAQRRHIPALVRLEKLATASGKADLARAAALAQAASRGPRSRASATVPLDQMGAEEFAAYRGVQTQIETAQALGDRDALAKLQSQVGGLNGINERLRRQLKQSADDAVAALGPAPADAAGDAAKTVFTSVQSEEKKAEEKKADEPAPKQGPKFASILGKPPAELVDPGFDRIDLAKIGEAWSKGNAEALADLAFRMAEEERVLKRPHKFVPAQSLFEGARLLAQAAGDTATLARLEKDLKETPGGEAVAAKIEATKNLALASRKGRAPFMAAIDSVSPESYVTFHYFLGAIRAARFTQDTGTLTAVTEGLDSAIALDNDQRTYLRRLAAEARETIPAQPNPQLAALRQLAAASRGGLPEPNQKVLTFCKAHLGRSVGDGSSGALAASALEAAATNQGHEVTAREVQPGDVVTFRNVQLKATWPNGSTREWTYANHTAVVAEVLAPGSFALLHQDSGPAAKPAAQKKLVQYGTLELGALRSGTVTFYRPATK